MRRTFGFVLLGLGAALLVVGVLTTTWAPGQVKKTPTDVNTTTRLDGTASQLGGAARPIKITSITRTDSKVSDAKNVAFVAVSCVMYTDQGSTPDCGTQTTETDNIGGAADGGDSHVLTISIDRFVTDKVSALAVSEEPYIDQEYRGPQHDGLVNKFPFDTKKTTYPYWDSLTNRAWDAKYVGEEKMQGLKVYHFHVSTSDDNAEVIPGDSARGTYTNEQDIWVEPETGAVVRQSQHQTRELNGEPILDLQADFTDDQVKTSVQDTTDKLAQLHLVTKTAPLVGFIGGFVLLLGGIALLMLGRRRDDDLVTPSQDRHPVTV